MQGIWHLVSCSSISVFKPEITTLLMLSWGPDVLLQLRQGEGPAGSFLLHIYTVVYAPLKPYASYLLPIF